MRISIKSVVGPAAIFGLAVNALAQYCSAGIGESAVGVSLTTYAQNVPLTIFLDRARVEEGEVLARSRRVSQRELVARVASDSKRIHVDRIAGALLRAG